MWPRFSPYRGFKALINRLLRARASSFSNRCASATARWRACFRQAVIAAALVVVLRRGPGPHLHDQALRQQALDDAVQRAGAELDFAGSLLLDLFQDRVAMLVAVGQGKQHVEHRRRERRLGVGHLGTSLLARLSSTIA